MRRGGGGGGEGEVVKKEKIIYTRVSSPAQRGEQRQSDDLRAKFPTHVLITDIASGINFQRRGLKTILDRAHRGAIDELVVAHKDRLCRFAFDLVRDVLARSGCKIVVLGQANEPGGEAELTDDMLAIATVFVAKRNGQRSARNHQQRRKCKEEAQGRDRADVYTEGADLSHEGGVQRTTEVDRNCAMDLQSVPWQD